MLPWKRAGSKSDAEMKETHFAVPGFTEQKYSSILETEILALEADTMLLSHRTAASRHCGSLGTCSTLMMKS